MSLRPVQGAVLCEAGQTGGIFAQIRVGGGKTLLTGLLPLVLGSERPLVIVPSALKEKTLREYEELRLHFQIPRNIRVEGYSRLGRCDETTWEDGAGVTHISSSANIIDDYAPDCIIADEAHKLKNIKTAAVARRIAKRLANFPSTKFCALSGSPAKDSVLDYLHLVVWALRQGAPVPQNPEEWESWAMGLDANVAYEDRPDPRAFEPHFGKVRDVKELRAKFQERFESTPGVIVSLDMYEGSELALEPIVLDTPEETEEHFVNLRTEYLAPDDYSLGDARFQVWGLARQLALGFCYVHDPRPPKPWLEARKRWCKFVRQILELSDDLDSELQVRRACIEGILPGEAWFEWEAIQDTFRPNTVPMWFSDHAIKACVKWANKDHIHGGIVWTEHTEFARRLAKVTGWQYYGEEGLNGAGCPIEQADPSKIAIASLKANSEGRNLQMFHRALVTCPMHSGRAWEQLLGREFRDGQKAKRVVYSYFVSCIESIDALRQADLGARFIEETTGQPQLLLHCARKNVQPGFGSAYSRTMKAEGD